MTPNGDEDNEDGNSKNNDKATTKPTVTTEEGEPRQRLAETIAAEDIVIPVTLPLRPRLPHCDTLLSDHDVLFPGREVFTLYYT